MANMSFRYSDQQIMRQFESTQLTPEINYHKFNGNEIRYLKLVRDSDLPFVVFIHGAPGSLADYLKYFKDDKLHDEVNLISVDRIGYGKSNFGTSETSLKIQCDAIQSIISHECKSNKIILVGHSYGGPVAIKMAMDFGPKYQGVLLLAPALDPENEKEIRFAQLPQRQPIRWLTPPALRVAADEKNTHVDELKKILNDYGKIAIPVCHIHGTADSLVPYENLEFSRKNIPNKWLQTISLKSVNHFLPWTQYGLVVDKILEMSRNVSSAHNIGENKFSSSN